MEARMDQLEQVVIISRCTCRVFGRDQWLALQVIYYYLSYQLQIFHQHYIATALCTQTSPRRVAEEAFCALRVNSF
jgi:hypothetical protein